MSISPLRFAGILALLTISPAHAEERGVIAGKAIAPIGQSVKGTVASACPFGTATDCIDIPVAADGRVAPFRIPGLDPGKEYSVLLWKDANGDGQPNQGDLVGSFMRYVPQSDRMRPFVPTPKSDPAVLPMVHFHQFGNVSDTFNESFEGKGQPITSLDQIVGTWISEKSGPGEMSLGPSTGLVREGAGQGGTSMAVGVLKPRARYIRKGALLTVRPDGAFTWVSADDEFDSNNCSTLESSTQTGIFKLNRSVLKVAYDATTVKFERQCQSEEPNAQHVEAGEFELPISFQEGADKRMRMRFGNGPEATVFVKQ